MTKLFKKSCFTALLALLSLNSTSLMADDTCCPSSCNRFYIGAFGGGLYSNKPRAVQTGVAFFTEAEGGPLAVDARGHLKKKSTGFGGVQIGYEWTQCPINLGCSDWSLTPGVEIEGYWYHHKRSGEFINDTNRLDEHDFINSFSSNVGVYLINGFVSLNSQCFCNLTPYLGGGIGAAHVSLHRAKSIQIEPPEAGINHFNTGRNDSDWAFAAQAKVGLRYNFCERFHVFAEYRFLFIDRTNYLFGATNYPTHAATTTWNFNVHKLYYNAFAIGLQYDL